MVLNWCSRPDSNRILRVTRASYHHVILREHDLGWSGESNPRLRVHSASCYHYTNSTIVWRRIRGSNPSSPHRQCGGLPESRIRHDCCQPRGCLLAVRSVLILRRTIWNCVRESNPSLRFEGPRISPEIQRSIVWYSRRVSIPLLHLERVAS